MKESFKERDLRKFLSCLSEFSSTLFQSGEIFYSVKVVEEIKNMRTQSSFLQNINLSGVGSYSDR